MRKTLCYLANIRFPSERAHAYQIAKSCEAFVRIGYRVTLVVPKRYQTEFIKKNYDIEKLYNIKDKFDVVYLNLPDPFYMSLGKFNFIIHSLLFSIWGGFYVIFKKPEIIYSRYYIFTPIMKLFGRSLILENHEYFAWWPKWLNKFLHSGAKKIIANTEALKKHFISMGLSEDKLLTAPNGVDEREFYFNKKNKPTKFLFKNKKVILYTGSFYDWKGVFDLIDAASLLPENMLVVLIGGIIKDRKGVRKYIFEKHLEKKVIIKNYICHKLVVQIMKQAYLLVLPNTDDEYSKYFTSPIKLFEYLVSGIPIVASDLPSIREIVDKRFVKFFKAGNHRSLAQAIINIEPTYFSKKNILERRKLGLKYTWIKRARKIEDFINQ